MWVQILSSSMLNHRSWKFSTSNLSASFDSTYPRRAQLHLQSSHAMRWLGCRLCIFPSEMTSQHNTQSQVLKVVTKVDWVPGAVARNHFISSIIGNLYNQNEQKLSELNFAKICLYGSFRKISQLYFILYTNTNCKIL